MFTRRIGAFGVLVILAVAGSGLLLAQSPQPVATWAAAGVAENAYGDGPSVALEDGRTLIVGGALSDGSPTDLVSIFDAARNTFTTAGVLLAPRTGHTATLLKDGRVLIIGGLNGSLLSADVELFDPVAGTSALVTALPEPRTGHAAARLNDGRVVIIGGRTVGDTILRTALVFDPDTNSFAPFPGELHVARAFASATTLLDGRVIVIGGTDGTTDLASAEIFDPLSQSFSTAATALTAPVHGHSAVLLPHNGSVLVVGGTSNGAPQGGVDLFLPAEFPDPFSYGEGRFSPTASLSVPRSNVIAAPTPMEGYAFVAGGGTADVEHYRFVTIKTDKDDYAPGEHAVITGTGWQPGEPVTLLFQEDPAVHDDYMLTLIADGQGNIYSDEWAPEQHDLNVRFYLTASDSRSKAQTTFTDGNLSSTINFTITSGSVAPGATLTWNVTALCQDGGGPNTCASEGFTGGGPVQNGYEVIVQQATDAAFTQNLVARATTTTTSGSVSGSFAAPASGGPFYYRARHGNQNLPNVPAVGNTTNSWQPQTSASFTVTLSADTTAPVITPVVTGTLGNDGWYTSDVNVSWTVTDPESAISSTTGCSATVVTTDTAGQVFTCTATSAGGTNSASVTIKRDASAPNAPSAAQSPAANASGWNTTDVSVSFTNTGDNGPSGIASCTSTVSLTAETTGTAVNGTCTDNAGNVSPATSVTVKIDKTAPIISASRLPLANANGWNNSDVTVSYTASDATSGLDSPATGSHVFTSEGAGQSFTFTVSDLAGNSASVSITDVNIDKTAPGISATRLPAANANGWNNTDVVGSYTASDALSGLDSPSAGSYTFANEGAGQQHTFTVVDRAGNSATASILDVNIDKTAPVVAVTGVSNGAVYTFGAVPAAGCTTADALSGVSALASLTVSGGVPPGVGSFTASCSGAIDKAGNTASAAAVYTVQFASEGALCNGAPGHQMLQPIDFTGSSVFGKKGNSTVPAKFRVCGADGVSIGPTPVVSSFVLYGVLNGTAVDVNETAVDSTNSDTAFRWSASDAQWIFNISTRNLTAGMTYVYRVYLNDGSYIQFQFGLK